MFVLHGIGRFGKVDGVDGEHLATRCLHVMFLPLVPLGSDWVTRRDGKLLGRACRLSGRSVLHAYVRTWGLVAIAASAVAGVAGATELLLLAAGLAIVVGASFAHRRLRDPRELRRVVLQRPVLGMALDPAHLPRDTAVALLPLAQERFDAVSGGRNAFDVARRGAATTEQAAHAFVLLRLHVAATLDPRATAALADAEALLDRPLGTDAGDGPYRSSASPRIAMAPLLASHEPAPHRGNERAPLLASYELAPHSWHFVAASLTCFVVALLVGPEPSLKVCSQDKDDIARSGVRKLAFESYPHWTTRPANAGTCPTVQELAEYGGSVKDPWGEPYRIRCTDLPPGVVGIAVWSTGADKRVGTADDITSWDP